MRLMLSPSYLDSPSLAQCSRPARDYWHRIIVATADTYGCFIVNAASIWGRAFPQPELYPDVLPKHISSWLDEYEQAGMLERWTENGRTYGFWTGWFRHNRPDSRYARTTPEPPSSQQHGKTRRNTEKSGEMRKNPANPRLSGSVSGSESGSGSGSGSDSSSSSSSPRGQAKAKAGSARASRDSDPEPDLLTLRASMVQSVQERHAGVPWVCPDVHDREIASLLYEGVSAKHFLDVWEFYVETRNDPAKISVEWFVKNFNTFQADRARARAKQAVAK